MMNAILRICFTELLLAWTLYAQVLNSCEEIENCFHYHEDVCDSLGRRQVCLTWVPLPGCTKDPRSSITNVCREKFYRRFPLARDINNAICTDAGDVVPGGTSYSFGINDGGQHNNNVGSGPVTILNYPNNPAMCHGYTNLCEPSGNDDIVLTFHVSPCPQTSTTTKAVTTPSTTPFGCVCDPWIDFTHCSTTCGNGMIEQRRTCRGCPRLPTVSTKQFVPCHDPEPCSVDGMWGGWSSWNLCPTACGVSQRQFRSRVCDSPSPSGPIGRDCEPPSSEERHCPMVACTTVRTTVSRRACRQTARRFCRQKNRRVRRRCMRNTTLDCLNGLSPRTA